MAAVCPLAKREGPSRTPIVSQHFRRKPLATSLAALAVCAVSGCAALSLFSQTHTHTHTHGTPEMEQRLQTLEMRIAGLESRLSAYESVPTDQLVPVLPAPSL